MNIDNFTKHCYMVMIEDSCDGIEYLDEEYIKEELEFLIEKNLIKLKPGVNLDELSEKILNKINKEEENYGYARFMFWVLRKGYSGNIMECEVNGSYYLAVDSSTKKY